LDNYNAESAWTLDYSNQKEMSFPSEYVIRIFKGSYPRLNFDKKSFKNKKICDVGCGDGRHFGLLQQCGFENFGTELTEEIIKKTKTNLSKINVSSDIRVGTNDNVPFEDNFFDYILSWNSCYYMGKNRDFKSYVMEFSRILQKNGYLILSIPKKSCFIFQDSETLEDGYQIIKNDPFNIRNGEVLRMFENKEEIEKEFSEYFTNFIHASIHDDCFGYNYHWFLVVCQKK